MTKRRNLIAPAIALGVLFTALAVLYFVDSAGSLPSFIPGHEAGSGHHHIKHGIASLVHQRTGGELSVEDAALYQALHRLERQGLIEAEWGPSENNRRARYYSLTKAGRKQIERDTRQWEETSAIMTRFLAGNED